MIAESRTCVGRDHKLMFRPLVVGVDAFVRARTFEGYEFVASFVYYEAANCGARENTVSEELLLLIRISDPSLRLATRPVADD